MTAPEASGFPGQLELAPDFDAVAVGGGSYLVYPRTRHEAFERSAAGLNVCLVSRDQSNALRATLRRLDDPSLPPHRVVVFDGGSDDWSLSDAVAHAAAHDNAIVYRSAREATLGSLYRDALDLVGTGTAMLTPVHPELAAAALVGFAAALERAGDTTAAIAGTEEKVLHGARAAAELLAAPDSGPAPLMAIRGPVRPPPSLARCTTHGGVALALCGALQHRHVVVAPLPPVSGWPEAAVPLGDVEAALEAIAWPASAALRGAAAHRLGSALQRSGHELHRGRILPMLARLVPSVRETVAIEHPTTGNDEDTRAFADALDRAGIVVVENDTSGSDHPASWGIRWAPPAAPGVTTAFGRTATRLVFPGATLPDSWIAAARTGDALLVPSSAHAAACRAAGLASEKLTVVGPVVDTTVFRPGLQPIRLGQDGAFTFLLVTPWNRAAGWDVAVAAYAHTFTAADRVSLVIVVADPDAPSENEISAAVLEALEAARPGAGDDLPDVSLHTTPLVLEHMSAVYAGSDCLVAPGRDGGIERSPIEAMASGLPVIAPLRPVLAEIVDETCGFPLPAGWVDAPAMPDSLGEALAAAAADRAGTAARGAEARRRAVAVWSGDQSALAVARALGLPELDTG